MALPISPNSISLSQVAVELGRSASATTSLGETAVRALAGVASGAISLSNLYGKSSVIQKGFSAGGFIGGAIHTGSIRVFDFTVESTGTSSATLSIARSTTAGVNSNDRGYYCTGITSGPVHYAEIDGLEFSNETSINPSATLALARTNAGATNSNTRGYVMGGSIINIYYAEIDGLIFSSETAINPSAALVVARPYLSCASSSTVGYGMGGQIALYADSTEIDGIIFSTETVANPAAVLGYTMAAGGEANSSSSGYAVGDSYPAGSRANKLLFASETISVISGSGLLRENLASLNSSTNGYFLGGFIGSTYYLTGIDGITFSTDTVSNPTAVLPEGIYGNRGTQPYANNP